MASPFCSDLPLLTRRARYSSSDPISLSRQAQSGADQQKRANYDVALLQSAIETRELKNQLADSKDEIGRLRNQLAQVTRDNEKLKRELSIMGSGNASASRDATLLAEVQMQLVEANSRVLAPLGVMPAR